MNGARLHKTINNNNGIMLFSIGGGPNLYFLARKNQTDVLVLGKANLS